MRICKTYLSSQASCYCMIFFTPSCESLPLPSLPNAHPYPAVPVPSSPTCSELLKFSSSTSIAATWTSILTRPLVLPHERLLSGLWYVHTHTCYPIAYCNRNTPIPLLSPVPSNIASSKPYLYMCCIPSKFLGHISAFLQRNSRLLFSTSSHFRTRR